MMTVIPMLPVVIPGMVTVSCLSLFYCMKPESGRHSQVAEFEKYYIAHRGFHDNQGDAPENSLPAFEKAARMGYGIEMDVQLTKDKIPVVFHDYDLNRACGVDRRVDECTYEELCSYPLFQSKEQIPTLAAALHLIRGRSPLIIEIKVEYRCRETCRKVADCLDYYHGPYCIESFSPLALRWFWRHRPAVLRGQLATNHRREGLSTPWPLAPVLSNCLLNAWCKPDFVAYNCRFSRSWPLRLMRKLYKCKLAAWTIKDQQDLDRQRKRFDLFIFDSFLPDDQKQ